MVWYLAVNKYWWVSVTVNGWHGVSEELYMGGTVMQLIVVAGYKQGSIEMLGLGG